MCVCIEIVRVILAQGLDGFHDLSQLVVDHRLQHAVPYSVAIHDDARRQAAVVLVPRLQGSCEAERKGAIL